ncbi:MAG: hypothetical protein [Vetruanivirus porcinprimi]|uniref:Uncharacterized protein n=1 Tax=phage Lak_Megaphage_RVC_AP1_GC26 TaxID=3109224 RepID=A0ABZ0Z5P1_9CAUD|nr:MAG: hypothetical protein [phage Lak_Megaphage_RVC_AP1_GC26]
MAKMKENLSDIFSEVNKELLNSTKDKFNKLSSVEKKKVLDSTNKLMDAFYDICGVENKYHLTEEMFDDTKEKCKETIENIKDSIKESKDNLAEIARDTLNKLGISDEFIKTCKVDNDKIYIDVQMPVDSDIDNIDLDINNDGVSYDHQAEESHNIPKFTRKNKVKNKKVRFNNKIKFKDNHLQITDYNQCPVNDTQCSVDDNQCSVKTTNLLDRLKAEAKENEVNEPKINLDDIKQVLIDKIEAILEDDNTHAYTVYPHKGDVPASVQVILDDVCSCVREYLNILTDVADVIKDKYGFPEVYVHIMENDDDTYNNDNTVSIGIVCILED